LKLGPKDASERLDDRLAIEIGLLEGVDPRLDEKDIMVELMSRCPSPSPVDSNVVDKLRLEELKVVVLREAANSHLIVGEAVRESCVLHSADYAE
jgi:hypothetical protein